MADTQRNDVDDEYRGVHPDLSDHESAERDPETGELVGNPGVRKKLADMRKDTPKALEELQIPMGPEPETVAPAAAEEDDGGGPRGNGELDDFEFIERNEDGSQRA